MVFPVPSLHLCCISELLKTNTESQHGKTPCHSPAPTFWEAGLHMGDWSSLCVLETHFWRDDAW